MRTDLSKLTLLMVLIALNSIFCRTAQAQAVWDGGGADDFWMTPANWIGDAAPVAGAALQFAGPTRLAPNNNFAADTAFAGITFNAGAGSFALGGNGITLSGNITNSSSVLETISLPIKLSTNLTFNAGTGGLNVAGNITNTATATATQEITLVGNAGSLSGVFASGTAVNASAGLRFRLNAANNTDTWSMLGSNTSTMIGQLYVTRGVMNYGSANDANNAPIMNLTFPSTGLGEAFTVGSGGIGTSGTFNMNNGTLTLSDGLASTSTTAVRFALGNTAAATGDSGGATWNQTGGTLKLVGFDKGTTPGFFGANQSGTTTAFNISGGLFDDGTAPLNVAVRGVGSLNISGTGTVRSSGSGTNPSAAFLGVTLNDDRQASGNLASVGTINLNAGGTLEASRDSHDRQPRWSGSKFSFQFQWRHATSQGGRRSFLTLFNSGTTTNDTGTLNVKSGGAVIDSNGFDIGFTLPLLHDTTGGPAIDGGLIKNGAGTLTLSGNNTYTGATAINAGTLQIGTGTIGSINTPGGVTSSAGTAIVFNSTANSSIGGVVAGGLALTNNGTSAIVLGGANTYTGATTINAGSVTLGNGSTVGPVTVAGGVLRARQRRWCDHGQQFDGHHRRLHDGC